MCLPPSFTHSNRKKSQVKNKDKKDRETATNGRLGGQQSRLASWSRAVMCRHSPGAVAADGSGALLSNSWLLQPASPCHHTPPPEPRHWTHSSASHPPSSAPVSQGCQQLYYSYSKIRITETAPQRSLF